MKLPAMRSVRHKLTAIVLLTTLVALLVALGAIVAYNLRLYHRDLVADMSTQAELLGHMTAPALSFDDRQLAQQNISWLSLRSAVKAAAIFNAGQQVFASYRAPGEAAALPARPQADGVRIDGHNLVLYKRIVNDGEVLGTVYLRADYGLAARLADYLGIAAVVMLIAMAIAYILTTRLQAIITAPIQAISGITRDVIARRDYSQRAAKLSNDEVGTLVDSFNDMLAEIERRTADLVRSNREKAQEVAERARAEEEVLRLNANLEDRVRERTAELERVNRELGAAMEAAERANQAKSAFLSSMSHELRTPLNAILGFTQLLGSEELEVPPAKRREFTTHILKAGHHLLVLINEVLDLAKIETGALSLSLEPVALDEVMFEARQMIEPLADARGVLLRFPAPQGLHVVADCTRIKQVLLNLLSNAVKYNREQGAVIVGCGPGAPGMVRITVQDSGRGLPPDQIEQLFQPFNRLGQEAGTEEGTGIGLVVTKRLVELMQGTIGVSSIVGSGSVFWIELPRGAAPGLALGGRGPAQPAAVAPAPDRPLRKVLYVEDNPANLKLVQEIFVLRPDLQLLTAADARLGIELAHAHLPAAILMDINLPGMSGHQALHLLRGTDDTRHIPVIALTANAMPRDVKRGAEEGFFRYLIKPINIPQFLDVLDLALEQTR